MIKKISTLALIAGSLALAVPAFAKTTVPTAAQVACVGSAVGVRESALDSAITAFTQAENSAYTTRASALEQAYTLAPGGSTIKNAVKAAWLAFTTSEKSSRKSWQTARNSAWSTFRTSVRACKAPIVPTDSAHSSSEAIGQ